MSAADLVYKNRVKETTTTTGTGDLTLAGAATGYQAFDDAFTDADMLHYLIEDPATGDWEVGTGTFTAPATLERTAVQASSNANAAVSFGAGTKRVSATVAAEFYAMFTASLDISGTDLDSLVTNGFYGGNSLTNAPGSDANYWHVIVQRGASSANNLIQIAHDLDTTGIAYVRWRISGTFGPWRQIPNASTAMGWSAQQYIPLATLTDGANIGWAVGTAQKAKVTLGGNRTMDAVTGAVEGASYLLWVIQDGTGSRTISWTTSGAGSFDFGADGAPTLTTTASKADLLAFEAISIGGTLKLRFAGIKKGFA